MIVFCGYANNDVTVHVPHVPVLGERVQATAISQIDGGMNANAAVSAARMGAQVIFAGAVGPDARSTEFLEASRQMASTPVGRREMRSCRRQLFSSRRTAIAPSSARTTRTMPNASELSSPDWPLPAVDDCSSTDTVRSSSRMNYREA